ncbi:LANO_0G14576g1_1 [Lachancea nothofagi CBS 11611]|uniref:LANO_0G14576g1_1 n=1 Tax=Lachancea nothofagi CBS 11611 TaxID=1266666 RepID=A0A1G4KKA6_9SACH|nr:LANO_0G14576g1_1 [Lachancea nothofagi CBS 11611]
MVQNYLPFRSQTMKAMAMLSAAPLLINCIAVLYQRRYNRLHKSIHGLSYDLYVLSFISYLFATYCGVNYLFSALVRKQLIQRFPVFFPQDNPEIPVSKSILLTDILNLVCSVVVLKQLMRYRYTKHEYQSVSFMCISVVVVCATFCVFTYACASLNLPLKDSGRFGVFYLEHINYSWVIGTFLSGFRLVPQIMLNYMGTSTQGVSSKFIILSIASVVLQLTVGLITRNQPHYRMPLNGKPLYEPALHLVFLIFILYQAQYVYRRRTGRLAKALSAA